MFDYIKGIIRNYCVKSIKEEMINFITSLEGASDKEAGAMLGFAAHIRNKFSTNSNFDFLDPIIAVSLDRSWSATLLNFIKKCQQEGSLLDAAGAKVWLYTLEAASFPELRIYGRKMWKELSRGLPYAIKECHEIEILSGIKINLDGYDKIPIGLEPSSEPTHEFKEQKKIQSSHKKVIMTSKTLEQVVNHLAFLGYKVNTMQPQKKEDQEFFIATHPNRNHLIFMEPMSNFILFEVNLNSKTSQSPEMNHYINQYNCISNIVRACIPPSHDGQTVVRFVTTYNGEYSKEIFGQFYDLLETDIRHFSSLENFSKIFIKS